MIVPVRSLAFCFALTSVVVTVLHASAQGAGRIGTYARNMEYVAIGPDATVLESTPQPGPPLGKGREQFRLPLLTKEGAVYNFLLDQGGGTPYFPSLPRRGQGRFLAKGREQFHATGRPAGARGATVVTVQFGRYGGREDYERYGGPGGGPRPPLAPETNNPLPGRKVVVPLIFPVLGNVRWRDSYNVSRGTFRHTAIDISASKMQPIVAPFSGIIGFKTQTFWIFGDNGYKCLGTHLNDDTPGTNDNRAIPDYMFAPNLRPGDHVTAGQFIGYVGDSGKATGPHLHFELFDRGGGLINPFFSLKAASHITAPRPVLSDRIAGMEATETRIEGCFRKWDPDHKVLTLLVVTRQAGGHAVAVTTPTWYRLFLPQGVIDAAGGDAALAALPRDRTLAFTLAAPTLAKGTPKRIGVTSNVGTAYRLRLPITEPERPAIAVAEAPSRAPSVIAAEPLPAPRRRASVSPKPAPVAPPPTLEDVTFEDFETGTYDAWSLQGSCWSEEPAADSTFGGHIKGFEGNRFLCSFHPRLGGAAVGSATSKEFKIERPFINFLIGGGQMPGETCINLLVDGKVVRSETGNNRRTLEPVSWDVSALMGRRGRIEILDRSVVPGLGYILVDAITFTAMPKSSRP